MHEKRVSNGALSDSDLDFLKDLKKYDLTIAGHMIENAVGYFPLPLAVVSPVIINKKEYAIPLVTEETSVVAAFKKASLWIRKNGTIETEVVGLSSQIGQLHLPEIKNLPFLTQFIETSKKELIKELNQGPCKSMFTRGGGVTDMAFRLLEKTQRGCVGVVHIFVDTKDSMGANIITQTCEYLKRLLEQRTDEVALMGILSNYNPHSTVKARIELKKIDPTVSKKIELASQMAQLDIHRAVTHNKGIFNGLDAFVIATGNDFRACEAACHAFACRSGSYKGLSIWKSDTSSLIGEMELPISLGIVGGAINVHPHAQKCLQLTGVESASDLKQLAVAAGLIQNLAALRALVSGGIVQGHMRLHIRSFALQHSLSHEQEQELVKQAADLLEKQGYILNSDVASLAQKYKDSE